MEIDSDAQACFIVPCPPVRSPLLGSRAAPHGDMGMVWYGMVWYGTQAHMVTGTQAQRATLLCPQPVVPCRLSIHRAVCPWVSCRLRRSHVGCPHNGMSVDPSTGCLYLRPYHGPDIPFSRLVHPPSRTRFPLSAQSRPHPAPFRASALSGLRPPLSP